MMWHNTTTAARLLCATRMSLDLMPTAAVQHRLCTASLRSTVSLERRLLPTAALELYAMPACCASDGIVMARAR